MGNENSSTCFNDERCLFIKKMQSCSKGNYVSYILFGDVIRQPTFDSDTDCCCPNSPYHSCDMLGNLGLILRVEGTSKIDKSVPLANDKKTLPDIIERMEK